MADPASNPATAPAAVPSGAPRAVGRRSKLVTWLLRLFLFFQGLAILQALIDLAWPTNFVDFPGLILGFSCLQNLSVIPLVLGVATWLLTRSNRYHRAANRLAKLVVLHFVLRLLGLLILGTSLFLLVLASLPNVLQSPNPSGAIQKEIVRLIDDHHLFFRAVQACVLLFELLFTGLALLARRALSAGHFVPAPAAATAVDGSPARNVTSGQKPPRAESPALPAPPPPTPSVPPGQNSPPATPGGPVSPSGE